MPGTPLRANIWVTETEKEAGENRLPLSQSVSDALHRALNLHANCTRVITSLSSELDNIFSGRVNIFQDLLRLHY